MGCYGLQIRHGKGVTAKFGQTKELAPKGVYLPAGLSLFDLYIQYSELSETKMPSWRELYSACYVWVGGFWGGLGA
jgi:hypothetical protein